MSRSFFSACVLFATLAAANPARGDEPDTTFEATVEPHLEPMGTGRGIAVLGVGSSRDEAFALARGIYAGRLRPAALDELKARVLAGDPAPETAPADVRELAELRASITGDDAASRRLLGSIGEQLGVLAIMVVTAAPKPAPPRDVGASGDAGALPAPPSLATPLSPPTAAPARLFLVASHEFDAARYYPEDTTGSWKTVVTSLDRRFGNPAAAAAPKPVFKRKPPETKPFYASAWFWGAVGGAALLGATFFFVSRDTTSDTIHLQVQVPR